MSWLIFASFVPSLLVAWAACYLMRHLSPRIGLIDQPGQRKVHQVPTPLGGGVAIWLAIVLPFAGWQMALWSLGTSDTAPSWIANGPWASLFEFVGPHLDGMRVQAPKLWMVLGAGTLLMLLGLTDDFRHLDWRPRLAVEVLVAMLMVWQGWRLTIFIELPWFTNVLSVLWIVGLINSFNFLDNMDGLSAGVAAIASAVLAAVMLIAPDPTTHQPQLFVGAFLLVVVGALVGFLWHNYPPARIFMGDSGAYMVGFFIAIAAMTGTYSGGNTPRHAILAPLCALAVPLYDTFTVVLIRLREGRSPFAADKSHFSHRLTDLGMTKKQAVLTIYLVTATTGLGALLLYQVDLGGAAVVLTMVACVLLVVSILETTGRRP